MIILLVRSLYLLIVKNNWGIKIWHWSIRLLRNQERCIRPNPIITLLLSSKSQLSSLRALANWLTTRSRIQVKFPSVWKTWWSDLESSVGNVSIGFDWLLFRPLPRKILSWPIERPNLYQRRGHEHISVLISMLPPQASKLVCFSSNDKCNHHSFFYSEKFSLCYIFSKTDKLFAFFVTLLPNRNEYPQIYTTWRLTEHGDCQLEMPNSIPSSPCNAPLVNSNKQKQLPASSLQSFTAMSARGLFLSKLERRLQCQITHRYTQSWGHKRELTQRNTARCEEYTASSHQLQLSAPSWMRKVASQFYVLLNTPKKQRSLSLTNQLSAILALFCSITITIIKKSQPSSSLQYTSRLSHHSTQRISSI